MAAVELRGVRKSFDGTAVIRDVDLSIGDGEFCVFVGPSGCGKSTLLRLVAGLENVSAGQIRIGGEDVTAKPPRARGIAMVFQSYALYPHMTVRENIAFGLEMGRARRAEIEAKVRGVAKILELDSLLDRLPKQLSGGQRQRVAIGRAIVREPRVFLFDEPLSNLDASLRVQMRIEIAKLHQSVKTTMIYVTHDQVEAMTLADKIVVLNGGKVEQVGAPVELYQHPRNIFVAGFIGSSRMNFLPARAEGQEGDRVLLSLPGGTRMAVSVAEGAVTPGESLTLGIRPEHVAIQGEAAAITGPIDVVEELGDEHLAYLRAADGTLVTARIPGAARIREGDQGRFHLPAAACYLFRADGAALPRPRQI